VPVPKYVVLKVLPQGQRPGELVDLHEDAGRVFLAVDAVRLADDDEAAPKPRRRYQRRDLHAEA
jgi:hypothetical protein